MDVSKSILESLKTISSDFRDNGVKFCLAGGLAVSIISTPRTTEDIDIIAVINEKSADKIKSILKLKFSILDDHESVIKVGKLKIWRIVLKDKHSENGFLILDIINADNDFLINAVNNALLLNVDDAEIPVIKPEDLVLIKMQSERLQDKRDADNIISDLGEELDNDYIEKHIKEFDKNFYS